MHRRKGQACPRTTAAGGGGGGGVCQCEGCDRWFRSAGGTAVHKCFSSPSASSFTILPDSSGLTHSSTTCIVAAGHGHCEAHCDL